MQPKPSFDEVLTEKMLRLAKDGDLPGTTSKKVYRPFNPVTNQPYTKESAVFLAAVENSLESVDPRFCTIDEGLRLHWNPTPGIEGNFVRKRVLYTEDPFGYPMDQKDWKFMDTPQLVFSATQFQDSPVYDEVFDEKKGRDILNQLCETLNVNADIVDDKIFGLAEKGFDAFEKNRQPKDFTHEDAEFRQEITALLLAMDLNLSTQNVSPELWVGVMESDPSAFRKAAADADFITSYLKHFSKELFNDKTILKESDLIERAAALQKPVSCFNADEYQYIYLQNMKFLLDHNPAFRKNRPEMVFETKRMEKELKREHPLKPSMLKRLDLFVGLPRKNVEDIISSFEVDGLSWRIMPMKKMVRSVSDFRNNAKSMQSR